MHSMQENCVVKNNFIKYAETLYSIEKKFSSAYFNSRISVELRKCIA